MRSETSEVLTGVQSIHSPQLFFWHLRQIFLDQVDDLK